MTSIYQCLTLFKNFDIIILMDKKAIILKFLKQYLIITAGCILFALGIALFLDANKVASGGVSGIAIILSHITPFDRTGVWIIILNVPLIILGAVSFGRYFTISTIYSTVVSSLFVELFNFTLGPFLPFTEENIVAGVIGGALAGIGIGIVFKMGSTTGGTDILVKVLKKKFRYIKTGIISLIIDIIIISVAFIAFDHNVDLTFYTVVSLVVMSFSINLVIYGTESAKLVYIITDGEHTPQICDKILKELEIGATCIDGEGAYTGNQKRIIMCAIKKMQYPKLCDFIHEIDPRAFTIVSSAKEIYGEGYMDHTDSEL